MRALFYTLVLLNVAFFGWAHWIDAPAGAGATAYATRSQAGRSLPTLALVGPPGAGAASAAPGETNVNAAPAAPGERCRSLGPFEDAADAARIADRLRTRGLSPSERDVDISVNDGYTVYIDQADAAAVRRALARLGRAGIADVHAASGPGGQPRISFGVFQDQSHAVRLAEQVRELGFKPVLNIHQSTLTTRWLDLQLQANEPEPVVEQLLGAGTSGEASGQANAARGAGVPAVAFSDCPAKGG